MAVARRGRRRGARNPPDLRGVGVRRAVHAGDAGARRAPARGGAAKTVTLHSTQRGAMTRKAIAGSVLVVVAAAAAAFGQQAAKPMSPEGSAHAQVLGTWTKGDR